MILSYWKNETTCGWSCNLVINKRLIYFHILVLYDKEYPNLWRKTVVSNPHRILYILNHFKIKKEYTKMYSKKKKKMSHMNILTCWIGSELQFVQLGSLILYKSQNKSLLSSLFNHTVSLGCKDKWKKKSNIKYSLFKSARSQYCTTETK